MIKKAAILSCLLVFSFQAVVFYLFLFISIQLAKVDAGEASLESCRDITISSDHYKNLAWLNENEFSYGEYLIDVKQVKTEKNGELVISCKIDIKEKDLVDKLAGHFKNTKNKKAMLFAPVFWHLPCKIEFDPIAIQRKFTHHHSIIIKADPSLNWLPPQA